jgi:hypothetical protein
MKTDSQDIHLPGQDLLHLITNEELSVWFYTENSPLVIEFEYVMFAQRILEMKATKRHAACSVATSVSFAV